MATIPGLRLVGLSRWYVTRPVPETDQPDFVNAVAHLEGGIDPELLLTKINEVEAESGRVRTVVNAARTLDIDILAMGQAVWDTPALTLPHPRMHLRGFVLSPLIDVAPHWRHPVLGLDAAGMLGSGFADQTVAPMKVARWARP